MSNNNHTSIEITTSTIVKSMLIILFFILLYVLKEVVIIFLFAIIIASALSPFASWLDERGIPRLLGVLLLYLTIFGLFVFVFVLVIPYFSEELGQLTQTLPKIIERLSTSLETVQSNSPQYLDFISELQNILESISNYLQQSAQSVVGVIASIFGGVFSFIAIIVISFYLAVTRRGIETFLSSVAPDEYEGYVINLWKRTEVKVGRWLQGQMLLGLIVGLVVYVGLSLMNIKFALILGVLAMLLEIVPIVGPVIAAIPSVFFALLQSPSLGLWVLAFYVVVQQTENHILVPLVFGKTIGLNPVVVIIALLVGEQLAGIPGMIISVPVATIVVEMLDDVAKHKEELKKNSV